MASRQAVDAAIAAVIFVVSAWVGTRYVTIPAVAAGAQYYQDQTLGPAVIFACGRGLGNPDPIVAEASPAGEALRAFLRRESERFDCSTLPATIATRTWTPIQSASRYLVLAVGAIWRLRGVSWAALAPLFGVMFGTVVAAAYLLLRLASNRAIASGATLFFASAGSQLANLPHLRDYSKAPFFVVTLLALGYVVTRPLSPRALVGWSAALGAWIGVGLGWRFDVAPYLAFFVIGMIVFAPGSWRAAGRVKLAAGGAAVVAFFLAASPILGAFELGNNTWHVMLLGLSPPHDSLLAVHPSVYQFSPIYSDTFVTTAVNAYSDRIHDGARLLTNDTPEYAAASGAFYREIVWLAPADFVARAWAAVLRTLESPFLPASFTTPIGIHDPVVAAWYLKRARWVVGLAPMMPVLPLIILAVLAGIRPLQATLVAATIVFFGGYASLQFQPRHTFLFELLPTWLLACGLQGIVTFGRRLSTRGSIDWPAVARATGRALALSGAVLAVAIVSLLILRVHQTRQVAALFNRFLEAPRASVMKGPVQTDGSRVRFPVEFSLSESAPTAVPSDMFLAEFGGPMCDFDSVNARVEYASSDARFDFSRVVQVPIPERADEVTHVLVASYGPPRAMPGPRYQFAGLTMAAASTECLKAFSRLRDLAHEPVFVDAVLPPDWHQRRLYETLAGWERGSRQQRAPNTYVFPETAAFSRATLARPLERLSPVGQYLAGIVSSRSPGALLVNGRPDAGWAYLSVWQPNEASDDDLLLAEGELVAGKFILGLVRDDRWVAQVPIEAVGSFRIVLHPPAPGRYTVILSGDVGLEWIRLTIDRVGWIRAGVDSTRSTAVGGRE